MSDRDHLLGFAGPQRVLSTGMSYFFFGCCFLSFRGRKKSESDSEPADGERWVVGGGEEGEGRRGGEEEDHAVLCLEKLPLL